MADKDRVAMTRSGFCAFESEGSHEYCQIREFKCDCECHNG